MAISDCYEEIIEEHPLLSSLFAWPESPSCKIGSLKNVTILAHGKKETSGENLVKVVRKSSSAESKKSVDLDLTGSPLKASFTLDEGEEDGFEVVAIRKPATGPSYIPLDTKLSRKFISHNNVSKDDVSPTFAVCDNNDRDRTLFLGSTKSKDSLSLFKVVYCGYSAKSSIMAEAMAEHEAEASQTSFHARATYDISDAIGQDENTSSVNLLFKWANPKQLREPPPVLSTKVELHVTIAFDDDRLACYKILDEIELLRGLKSGLDNQGLRLRKRQDEDQDIIEDLRKLLAEVKLLGPRSMAQVNKELEEDQNLEMDRHDVDLTDLLWGVLKKVESFAQLRQAWEFIFYSIKQEEIRPYIYARNNTKVSKIVKSIVRGEDFNISVLGEGAGPLEMLFEIGVEKLYRDYLFTILNNFLATRDELEVLLNVSADPMTTLEKLHCIQCVICVCMTFLSPDQECLRSIVQQSIKVVSGMDAVKKSSRFILHINPSHVKDKISNLSPIVWQCHLSSSSGLESTLHLSIDPPTDYVEVKVADQETLDIEESSKNLQYHIVKATAITRKLC